MKKYYIFFIIFIIACQSTRIVTIEKEQPKNVNEKIKKETKEDSSEVRIIIDTMKTSTSKVSKKDNLELINKSDKKQETQSRQCKAITKKGKQCRNMTKSPNGYCRVHGGN